jgi:ParB-like nuclease domain
MAEFVIAYQSPASLMRRKSNPRTLLNAQLKQIVVSICTFGFTNPVLVNENNGLIGGHGRDVAAKQLGLTRAPTVCCSGMTEAQIRAYVIVDNRLAKNAGSDTELLAIELQHLADLDLDFESTITGFEMAKINALLGEVETRADVADLVPRATPGPAVTRLVDLWQVGPHRLICGDTNDHQTYARLLDGERAQMVFTAPPYNLKIDGHVSGLAAIQHREFAMLF